MNTNSSSINFRPQLAPNAKNTDPDAGFAKLRWAQACNGGHCPNKDGYARIYMAVATDLPDHNSPYGAYVYIII
jgi:hypothetical protein